MKILHAIVVGLALLGLMDDRARAQIISNGDFSENAACFTVFPGYIGQVASCDEWNPNIPDWIAAGNVSCGRTWSGVNGSPGYAPYNLFGPASTRPYGCAPPAQTGTYAFIQQDGSCQGTLTQRIELAANTTYTLTFEAAGRLGDCFDSGSVTVSAGGGWLVADNLCGLNQQSFTRYTDTFTTGSNVCSAFIVLKNTTCPGSGETVCFTNVSIDPVPEPGIYALMGLGVLGFLGRAFFRPLIRPAAAPHRC